MGVKPLRLDKMLQHGYIQRRHFTNNESKGPAKGYVWLLLYGRINHVTGTDSRVYAFTGTAIDDTHTRWWTNVKAALASQHVPLFNTKADEGQSQRGFVFVTDDMKIKLVGAAACTLNLTVLEWQQ